MAATNLSDAELEHVAGAEQEQQSAALAWSSATLPDDLYQSFLRRIARHVNARGLPLGIIGVDAEYGTARLPRWDAEVERLEARFWIVVVA